MIENSTLWKEDLKRYRDEFIRYNVLEHLLTEDDHAFDYLQRAVFYSAFIIRKLLDSPGKVSDAVDNYLLKVNSINTKKRFDVLYADPDEYSHDWDHPQTMEKPGREVCNWLIHSFLFNFSVDDNGIANGFIVSTDKDRNKRLYHVDIENWLSYMDYVISDTITHLRIEYSENKGERIYTIKERRQ